MNEPLTRDEDTDELLIMHAAFRKAVAKHHAGRLELFFQLQFPEQGSAQAGAEQLFEDMDIMSTLEVVMMDTVTQHSLFSDVMSRQTELLDRARSVLSAAADDKLDAGLLRSLIDALRRFDLAINRFDTGLTSSLTHVDELTGLLNRTAMDRDLKRELAQAKRTGKALCVAMIDADHFKKVNDDYGHSFGDTVLEALADRFETSLRPRDRIYRYGGEEFLIMLPDTGLHQAEKVMERIRIRSLEQPISDDDISITQTVSIGLTEVNTHEEIDSAIERADEALYQAKQSGRNRLVSSPAPVSPE